MRIKKINTFLLLILFSTITFAQGLFTVSTDKSEYSYGEKIIVEMKFLNNSDSTFSFWADPYCITEISMEEVNLDLICSTADGDYHFPVGRSQTWFWILDPAIHGVPVVGGEQKVIGSFLHLMEDTTVFIAPKYYGGQISVRLKSNVNDEDLMSLRDSIHATVIQNEGSYQIWQIIGLSIDSLATELNNDYRLRSAETWRPIMLDSTFVTNILEHKIVPKKYILCQNYPNPFNPTTNVIYQLPRSGHVKIIVNDLLGKEVAVLEDRHKNAGTYEIEFNGSNFPSGVYLYSIYSLEYYESKKMLLLK